MTSGKKILSFTGGIVALLIVGKVGLGFINQPDDKTLITEALKEAQKAGREGRPGGVLDFLSFDVSINEEKMSGSRREIADKIKEMKPDIEFTKVEPIITGENARLESPATVKISIGPISRDVPISNAVITLKKQDDRDWLIIPRKSWKITDIRVSAEDLANFSTGF